MNLHQMNPYAMAFAIGYFYGRAYPAADQMPKLPAQDQYHSENQGFVDGLAAGRRDFQDVDLPIIAEAAPLLTDEVL